MKYLLLVRHAEPHSSIFGQKDIYRSLNTRGNFDAKKMAQELKNKKYVPDIIISSPANRAISTSRIIAEIIKYPLSNIEINKNIYYSSWKDVLGIIQKVPDIHNSLMIAGHNPAFHYLAQILTGERILSFATCTMLYIQFDVEEWSKIEVGKKKFMIYPELFKKL